MVHQTVGPHVQNLGLSNIEHNSRVGDHEILFFFFLGGNDFGEKR